MLTVVAVESCVFIAVVTRRKLSPAAEVAILSILGAFLGAELLGGVVTDTLRDGNDVVTTELAYWSCVLASVVGGAAGALLWWWFQRLRRRSESEWEKPEIKSKESK